VTPIRWRLITAIGLGTLLGILAGSWLESGVVWEPQVWVER
jgi:hypothetical protein